MILPADSVEIFTCDHATLKGFIHRFVHQSVNQAICNTSVENCMLKCVGRVLRVSLGDYWLEVRWHGPPIQNDIVIPYHWFYTTKSLIVWDPLDFKTNFYYVHKRGVPNIHGQSKMWSLHLPVVNGETIVGLCLSRGWQRFGHRFWQDGTQGHRHLMKRQHLLDNHNHVSATVFSFVLYHEGSALRVSWNRFGG